jgi:hypothetical protein
MVIGFDRTSLLSKSGFQKPAVGALILSCLLLNLNAGTEPKGNVPGLETSIGKGSSPYCIFAALSKIQASTLYIFAPNGEPLYYNRFGNFCYDLKLHPDGRISYFDDKVHAFILMDSFLNETDTIRARGYVTDYHELQITEDGSFYLVGLNPQSMDMSEIISGGNADATVLGMVVQRLNAQKELEFEWDSFDYFNIGDSYAKLKNSYVDYAHINTIEIDSDSSFILSSRNLNELTRVDSRTGDIIWRLGGKNNQFSFENFSRDFSGQHAIRRKNDSIYTLYDNGINSPEQTSRGIEFIIDEDLMLARQVREYKHDPEVYSSIMGNLQNLDNGNTFISWGANAFSEYDAQNRLVHEGRFINCDIPSYGVNKYRWKNTIFTADSELLDYTSVNVGETATKTVFVRNNSEEILMIDEFVWSQPSFSVENDNRILMPGEAFGLEVSFKPESKGFFQDTLTLRSNQGRRGVAIQVALKGTGDGLADISQVSTEKQIEFYPLPFENHISYKSRQLPDRIEIRDIHGRLVRLAGNLNKQGNIDARKLNPGIYLISAFFLNDSYTNELIIKY